jgi:hypothetical protein
MSPVERDTLPQELIRDPVDGVAHPSHPPRLVAFAGLVGDSDTSGRLRLYLDEELRHWFELDEGDVVYSERRNVHEGMRTVLWVDERATLHVRQAQAQEMDGEYLRGNVAAVTVPQTAAFVQLDTYKIIPTPYKYAKPPCPCSADTTDAGES